MALKDLIPFGMSLPHRSADRIDTDVVRAVATRAEALGFRDLWVTDNTLDHVTSFDPVVVLTYAAALTSRIGLGASVLVLPAHDPRLTAHQWASLDCLSNGRAIMGVGIGRPFHYKEFQITEDGRVARLTEQIELIRALMEPGKSHPPRPLLPGGGCQAWDPSGAKPVADLDGHSSSECDPPGGKNSRRLDGGRGLQHG